MSELGKKLASAPNLEPAGIRIHFDENELFRSVAAANIGVTPVIPILGFDRDSLARGGLAAGVGFGEHQHGCFIRLTDIVDAREGLFNAGLIVGHFKNPRRILEEAKKILGKSELIVEP